MGIPDRQITILHVLNTFEGDYPLFNQTVLGLQNGYKHIVCYLAGISSGTTILGQAGIDIRWLSNDKKALRTFKYQIVRELEQIIKHNAVDLIHAQRHKSVFYAILAARKNSNVRLITTVHGFNRSRSFLRKIANRILWPRIDRIIAVSEAVKIDILKANSWFPAERIEVIYNGIDLERFGRNDFDKIKSRSFFGLPEHCWIWGAVGRLVPTKGHDILLKAWARNKLGKGGGHLAIAGDGKLYEELKALSQGLGIADEITLLGHVDDIPKFLSALDGFVMPSRHEGFGLALVEAMAAGCPVVASKVGGLPEILAGLCDKGKAFLVPPENEDRLGEAMKIVMTWTELQRKRAILDIKQEAQLFDGKNMVARMNSLYQELKS